MLCTARSVDLGGQVVQHHDGGIVLGEIMLQREDLAAVAQRALRQQPDLRQAVDHDPLRLEPLDRFENALRGFAQLEVGRIQQALVVVRIEHAFRRDQLEDLDVIAERPAVRLRALAQLLVGFGEADIDAALAGRAHRP